MGADKGKIITTQTVTKLKRKCLLRKYRHHEGVFEAIYLVKQGFCWFL